MEDQVIEKIINLNASTESDSASITTQIIYSSTQNKNESLTVEVK